MSYFVRKVPWFSHILSLSLIAMIGFSVTACGGKQNVKKTGGSDSRQPDWILNTPIERGFLYGVGSAEIFGGDDAGASSRAKEMARAELIKQITVNISSSVEQEVSEIVKNGASDLTKKLRKVVKSQVPEFTLSNVKATDSYKSGKRVSVLVQLDVTKELQILRQKTRGLDDQIEEYEQKFIATNPSGMSAIRLVSPVLVLVDQRGELQANYNALAQTSIALIPAEKRDFVSKLYDRVAQMTVSIEAEGEKNDALKTGVISSLTERGLRISASGKSDLKVVYKLSVNSVKKEGSYFVITNGDIWIKDESDRVVKAFRARAKGVSGNEMEAKSRSVKKLSGQLGQGMMSALF